MELASGSNNYQIKNEEATSGYKVTMYSVIKNVNSEELRSSIVEEEYFASSSIVTDVKLFLGVAALKTYFFHEVFRNRTNKLNNVHFNVA